MPFALDGGASNSEIVEAVNYVLANLSQTTATNPVNGQITDATGQIVGYLYKYIFVKYADSFDGTVNFSDLPTNRGYYGIRNSDSSVESTNPADYVWTQVTGGFGTTKFLWYLTIGGRQIQWQVSTVSPNPGWVQDPGTAIDLDLITGVTSSPANFIVSRIANNSAAPTNAEVIAAIGRTPISGDLCTVVYNSGISSLLYRYTTGWAPYIAYISTDLILANTITATNIASNTITANNIAASTITGSNIAANTVAADNMVTGTITAASGIIGNLAITTATIDNNAVTTSVSQSSTTSFTFTAPSNANVILLITIVSTNTQVTTTGTGLVIATATLKKDGTTIKTFGLGITQYYVTASNLLYGVADGTMTYLDVGDGFSHTYTMTIPTGVSTCNWTAFIAKK